jgi:hypothetical protein
VVFAASVTEILSFASIPLNPLNALNDLVGAEPDVRRPGIRSKAA